VGQISHDIKGVLTGLDGGIYMVDSGMEKRDNERLVQGWEMVRRNVEKIRALTLNILYYAKDRQPEYRLCSPIKIVEDLAAQFDKKAAEAHVEIRQNLDPSAITLEADTRALQALLANLFDNALDACRADTEKAPHAICVGVNDEGETVLFTVSDDGAGMPPEAQEKAFTPFFSSKGIGGTGLGLYIANRIAAQHRGSITIISERGEGTTLAVRLPKRAPEGHGKKTAAQVPETKP